MAEKVCRIRWRKGDPLSLYSYEKRTYSTFSSFPPEIRDEIYFHALVASQPITVCSMSSHSSRSYDDKERCRPHDDKLYDSTRKIIVTHTYTIAPRDPLLTTLATGLLIICNAVVAKEAARIFYRYNTFHVNADEPWNPLYDFLQRIGDRNRACLRSLSVKPCSSEELLMQDSLGTRMLIRSGLFPFGMIQSSGHTGAGLAPTWWGFWPDRRIPYIDPAIEACFRILGDQGSNCVLKFILPDDGDVLPAMEGSTYDICEYTGCPLDCVRGLRRWPKLEFLNGIEMMRREFGKGVDLLFEGVMQNHLFEQERDEFRGKGWEIVETKELDYLASQYLFGNPHSRDTRMRFVLRMKEVTGDPASSI
jgi:hypothetical protein